MGTTFEFATAVRVVFGAGKVLEVPSVLVAMGATKVLVVSGRTPARARALADAMEGAGLSVESFSVPGEPTLETAREGTAAAVRARCDAVVSIGGGSVIDAGKVIAMLASNGGDPLDYIEVIGRGATPSRPSLPFVAIPTTAGTGSEVTRNAVLGSKPHGVKASVRSASMLPRLAVVDPDLCADAPHAVVRSSGLDALSQLIEPFVSARAQPLTDALAREGIRRSGRSLRRAVLEGADADAREDLALASLFGGLCLANAGLGAIHGFAAPAGAMFDAPHGAVCAALFVACMETNLRALRARAPNHPAIGRFGEMATILTGVEAAGADDGIAWIGRLCRDLAVPGLSYYGMTEADVPVLANKAQAASSMKANPVALTREELEGIARASLG
jgi:alcohol dehydrogenase class IV